MIRKGYKIFDSDHSGRLLNSQVFKNCTWLFLLISLGGLGTETGREVPKLCLLQYTGESVTRSSVTRRMTLPVLTVIIFCLIPRNQGCCTRTSYLTVHLPNSRHYFYQLTPSYLQTGSEKQNTVAESTLLKAREQASAQPGTDKSFFGSTRPEQVSVRYQPGHLPPYLGPPCQVAFHKCYWFNNKPFIRILSLSFLLWMEERTNY